MKICEQCGKEYDSQNKRFCSMECYGKSKSGAGNPRWRGRPEESKVCLYCGKTFYPLYERHRKYCSTKCYHALRASRKKKTIPIAELRGEKHPRWAGKRYCKICGAELFDRNDRRIRRCNSEECKRASIARKGHREERTIVKCLWCGKESSVTPSKKHRKFCSKKCSGQYRSEHAKDSWTTFICKFCKEEFKANDSRIRRTEADGYKVRFCSKRCQFRYYGPSSLEEKVAEVLDSLSLEYEQQHYLDGRKVIYDFIVPDANLLIEADSYFFHHSDWAKENGNWDRDREKDSIAMRASFNLLRLQEEEIKNNHPLVMGKIMQAWSCQKMLERF